MVVFHILNKPRNAGIITTLNCNKPLPPVLMGINLFKNELAVN